MNVGLISIELGTKGKESMQIAKLANGKRQKAKSNNEGTGTGRGVTRESHLKRKGQIK